MERKLECKKVKIAKTKKK